MRVPDISFKEYIALPDRTEYDYYIEYGKFEPEDVFNLGSFVDRSFEFVKDLQFYFYYDKKGFTWLAFFDEISKATGKTRDELTSMSLFSLYKAMIYVKAQIELIGKMETDYLGHAPTPQQKAANIDRFSSYGAFLQFDALANGDLTKYEAIKKLPYSLCFAKLKLEADRAEYQQDYESVSTNFS